MALLFLLSVLIVVPLAHAMPPDPSWIAGIYDGGDLDDLFALLLGSDGTVEGSPEKPGHPPLQIIGSLSLLPAETAREVPYPPARSRAPPA